MRLLCNIMWAFANPRSQQIFRAIDYVCRQAFRIAAIILVYNLVK